VHGKYAYYQDDWKPVIPEGNEDHRPLKWRWKNKYLTSIHMPHEAARTLCRITDIRVERVQDISLGDTRAEGIYNEWDGTKWWFGNNATDPAMTPHYKWVFKEVWNSIHGPCAWERNDWVWAYTFEVV
jgi:hypothetical protein